MRRINIERLHKVHEKKHNNEPIPPQMGQTELMIQNICSTVEVNFGEDPYTIAVTTRSHRNWLGNLLPRIAMELDERAIEFEIKNSEIHVSNVKISLYGHTDSRHIDMEFNDNF